MASTRSTGGRQPPQVSDAAAVARYKRAAARAAAELVQDGMRVGLGTGSTVAYLLEALAERSLPKARCVATSPETERVARSIGLEVLALDDLGELDIAIDGADQLDAGGWLIKGGGAAHTREKIVAASAKRFVVIVSAEKVVERLTPPVPLELVDFGVQSTLRAVSPASLRDVKRSPDGGLIADFLGPVEDPGALAARLSATPGVIEHGLFGPEMVSEVLIGGEDGVQRRSGAKPSV
jgi:ribose 5-phosphate isomerase A